MIENVVLGFLAFAAAILLKIPMSTRRHRLPVPPGPPGTLFIGNLLDIPTIKPWLAYRDWSELYGDIIYMDLPMKSILVVGSIQAAKDLFDRKSYKYSSRPGSVMIKLLSWDWVFSSLPYGQQWRTYHRHFHEHFAGTAVRRYDSIQLQESRTLLKRILSNSEAARTYIRSVPGSTIIRAAYGAHSTAKTDEYVQLAEKAMESARRIVVPAAFMAEIIPILKYIPGWMPGGSARAYAAKYKPFVQQMRDRPFDEVKQAASSGRSIPCAAYDLIRQLQGDSAELTPEQDTVARNVAGIAYAGASDTTTAAIENCVLAMAMFPDVQRRVQVELDERVGSTRLPEFSDLDGLTYLNAVIMESLRWMPVAPLGIPHALSEDDEYNGYYIPKGTMVVSNIWAMLQNPDDFPEPEQFKPERFLDAQGNIDPSVLDPRHIGFGFGRRVCPGSDFALRLLSICVASLLHVYQIEAGVDESGDPVVLSKEGGDEAIVPIQLASNIPPKLQAQVRNLGPFRETFERFCALIITIY
ncbi:hypothetical protein EIP91_011912 [Steccherinum ochraceum]|uniref:Cytochrome P450 n=1 Tax=Steccherinum ochraceum TaxID=92696 RepID=A0A4R0RH93_9APHY|nr:hypothetical protein EIP91_011912 [Steccherinum ochraceum]